jgi:ADP-dependent NAD(P)H-hydrate dehydratase / NAD(P)H-hydrate epimerase
VTETPHQRTTSARAVQRPRVAVVTAEGARDLDARTIATLPDSYALMHRAASAATEWIHAREARSAAVYVGTGNNGGDGWLIAGLLRERGWHITVHASGDPGTADAKRAKAEAERAGSFGPPEGTEALILDAILGTGATGAPRGTAARAIREIVAARNGAGRASAPPRAARLSAEDGAVRGATLIAIDIASGLDASTGDDYGALPADCTLTFGSVKRGHLLRRDITGELHVLDIGLVNADADVPHVVDAASVHEWIPPLAADAWKGTRGRLAIVGGDVGMAGAVIIAARGAHVAGVGMVRADVAAESAQALQIAAPFATVAAWRESRWHGIDTAWPHAMVIGPGLNGKAPEMRARVLSLLHRFVGPVVLDAGALTAFSRTAPGELAEIDVADGTDSNPLDALRHALRGRPALLTPHIGEFERLFEPGTAPSDRFDGASLLARRLDATVLLKGVPTIIASPDGERLVSATGNPALAMGGTGDLLAGIAGALLAQGLAPLQAGAVAAWVHGTAAERACDEHGGWRGVTMELLLHHVSTVWSTRVAPTSLSTHTSHSLLWLPAVPSR